jgi:subtilisin family serine protease
MKQFFKDFYREFLLLLLISFAFQCFGAEPVETRKVVAVVDTGLPVHNKKIQPYLCKGLQFDVTGQGIQDVNGHGTNILGIIASKMNNKTHCLAMIKWYHDDAENRSYAETHNYNTRVLEYMRILLKMNPSIVNMSLVDGSYSGAERLAMDVLLYNGAKIVVAAGNSAHNLSLSCYTYPACYEMHNKNFHVAAASDLALSNFKGPVTDYALGKNQCGMFGVCLSGSSQATANVTASLLGTK